MPNRLGNYAQGFTRLWAVLLLAALPGFTPGQRSAVAEAPIVPPVPRQAAEMLDLAVNAANRHNVAEFTAVTSGQAGSAAWVGAGTHRWSGDVLPVPGEASRAPTLLAVFHSFHTCESDGDHVYRLVPPVRPQGAAWTLGPEIAETDTLGLRIRDHAISAKIDVSTKMLTVHDAVTIDHAAPPAGAPAFGLFRLNEGYRIHTFAFGVGGRRGAYTQSGGVVAFVPPQEARFTISLDYTARLDHRNGDFIHDDEAVIASYWYPNIARLPATLSLSATSPPGWTPVAQGEQISDRTDAQGARTVAWRNDIPVSFFTLDMGRYRETSRQWKSTLLSVYQLDRGGEASDQLAQSCLDRLQDSLAFFDRTFGGFPYSRYAIVETRGPFNGALEAYSFATFGPNTLPEFIPHELSHTWWGGLIPCTYTKSMWNEAFANYSDDLYERSTAGAHEHESAVVARRLQERRSGQDRFRGISIADAADTDDDVQNAVGYEKASQVLRVLEEEIGQARMTEAMRRFLKNHRRGEAAEWGEFEAAVTAAVGADMHWFFAQWLDRPGTPRVAISGVTVRPAVGGAVIAGRIVQSGPAYRLKLPIAVELRSGAVVRAIVEVRDPETPFSIQVPGPPRRIQLDPEGIVPMAPIEPAGRGGGDPFVYRLE